MKVQPHLLTTIGLPELLPEASRFHHTVIGRTPRDRPHPLDVTHVHVVTDTPQGATSVFRASLPPPRYATSCTSVRLRYLIVGRLAVVTVTFPAAMTGRCGDEQRRATSGSR